MSGNSQTQVVRSLVISLYDGDLKERGRFTVPLSVAAPFANRILREEIPGGSTSIAEPWYILTPQDIRKTPFQRSHYPAGHTSLYGTRYDAEKEPPPRVRLHPEAPIVSFTVRIFDFQKEVFLGVFHPDDIFLHGAENLARRLIEKGDMHIEEGPFHYKLEASMDEVTAAPGELFPDRSPEVEGVFRLPRLYGKRRRLSFRKVPDPPLPERAPGDFENTRTCGRGNRGNGTVFVHEGVYEALSEGLPLSREVENGGYLLGASYRLPGSPEKEDVPGFSWLIEITDVVRAEGALANAGLLLFTGDTWSMMNRRMDTDFPDKKLTGWFHTHLFEATDEFGLSELDQDLHRSFFSRPWQVALLINMGPACEREVRCFQRGPGGSLVECTFEVMETG